MIKDFFEKKKLFSVCLFLFLGVLLSCNDSANDEAKKVPVVSNEDKVVNYISSLINSKSLESLAIQEQIDSIQVIGEISVVDSVNKSIYLGIIPQGKNNIYPQIKNFFSNQYGEVECNNTFCSWKNEPIKNSLIEVLLMDESEEKKFQYIVLEIEERND